MILAIVISGIVVNFIVLYVASESSPEGAMGMGPAFLLVFVPWLITVICGVGWMLKKLGVGE